MAPASVSLRVLAPRVCGVRHRTPNGLGVSLAILFVGAFFLATRIAIEERLMNKRFPDEYARYRERVPRLVPGLRVHRRSH